MERTIKVRTFLGQAIDTFKEYIKTKGNLQIDYSLEEYMQEILDYIDYLEKENQALKEKFKATNKGLQKVVLKRKKWKHRYQLAKCEIKELKEKLDKYEKVGTLTSELLYEENTKSIIGLSDENN